jgi:hypothetical protein
MQSCDSLIADNIAILRQGAALIARLGSAYSSSASPVLDSGVGGHFRHCIDFYNCFLSALSEGLIDYDKRSREEKLESNALLASESIERVVENLQRLTFQDGASELSVFLEGRVPSRSSVARELQSLLSHTVHHYALIAIALKLQGFSIPADFGVAPSTLKHWRKSA